MDEIVNSNDLLLENERLHKELQSLTHSKDELQKINFLFSHSEQILKVGYWEWDEIIDQYITCSEQFAKLHDMTVAQLMGELKSNEQDREFICEGDRERYIQVVDSAVERKQGWDIKYSSYTKAGKRIYLHEIGKSVLDDHGVLVKTIGTIQDITETRRLEEELKQSHALYLQAETMGCMGHFFWDRKVGQIIHCSDQYARIYGMTVPEVLEHFISFEAAVDLVHPDDKAFYRQTMYDCREQSKGFDGVYRIINSFGDTRHIYERSAQVLNNGDLSQSFGTIQDITEIEQTKIREKSHTHVLELITSGEPLPVILESIVRVVEQENPAMLCSILLMDDDGKHLLNGAASSLPDFYNEAVHGVEIGIGVGSCGTAAFINERVIVDDIQTHPYWEPYKELASKAGLGACWSEPIRSTKGEVLGTFAIYHHNVNFPTEANIVLIEQTASLASIAIERRQAEAKLEHLALYDLLTDLPNRVLLADRINHSMAQCQRRNQLLAVAYLDLDGFKVVNDTHGHDIGDKLLVALSQRMKEALRESDTLARIGGDEFIAVMVDLEKIEDSEPVLKRLLKAAAKPVTLGDAVHQVSASIGVTLYPQDSVDADQLIRYADQAMYIAKQAGKNRYHLFDAGQDSAIKIQQQSIGDVRSALDRREFVLHYQPKVNMHTGKVIGVEALIRWQHPDRGLVPPIEFLPDIEGDAISVELGEWVIETALIQISQWRSMGLHLPISVNISVYQLQQDDFTTRLSALLATHPELSPQCLELEILETSALNDVSQVAAIMNACQELGVRFALDDFGTGYSSLTHLRRLPAYLIKIDQSFVRDVLEDADDLAIVEGVIGLAKAFQREVIAEGVETVAHGVALLQLGCELAQGYGIARPMPADDIPEWVSNWKADNSWLAKSPIE
jgi:diguanylate cyclase (GGDEF)-like protein/PAS domain S-box-containing protein